jgi:di/tripeptidase
VKEGEEMNLPKKDVIATGLVAAAGVLYLLWVNDSSPSGLSGIRATGAVILVLGFVASAIAVVPSFDELLHGNKIYMTGTSLVGLVAAIGGVVMLVAESDAGLAVVMAAMVVLWLIATIHHSLLARTASPTTTHRTAGAS